MPEIIEIFGHAANDISPEARGFWKMGLCPHLNRACSKWNHDRSVCYGVCSVSSPGGGVVICPNRFYEKNYKHLASISEDCFPGVPFIMFDDFERSRGRGEMVVALGQNSGREVNIDGQFSLDWVLARVCAGELIEYTGVEVQSIDITGNYRDAWNAYRKLEINPKILIPPSCHGLNWANVHKRLIPQLIRKGVIFSRSSLVRCGMHFVLPELVYEKFEQVIGEDIPLLKKHGPGVLSVRTFELSKKTSSGQMRELEMKRKIHFSLEEFSRRFIGSPQSISGEMLDRAVRRGLGLF